MRARYMSYRPWAPVFPAFAGTGAGVTLRFLGRAMTGRGARMVFCVCQTHECRPGIYSRGPLALDLAATWIGPLCVGDVSGWVRAGDRWVPGP